MSGSVKIDIQVSRSWEVISKELELLRAKRDEITEQINTLLLERQGAKLTSRGLILSNDLHFCSSCGDSIVQRPRVICFRCNPGSGNY